MTAFFVSDGRHSGRAKVSLKKLFQRFLRSKTLMQDSTLGPNCHAIRVCPAAENLPILPPFLCSAGAPSAEKVRALKAGARWSFVYTPGGKTSSCDIREGAQSAFPLSAWGTCRTPAALHPADKEETAPPDTPPPLVNTPRRTHGDARRRTERPQRYNPIDARRKPRRNATGRNSAVLPRAVFSFSGRL